MVGGEVEEGDVGDFGKAFTTPAGEVRHEDVAGEVQIGLVEEPEAGVFDEEKVRRRFERASFRNALRKLRGGRRAKAEESKGTPPMSDPTPGGD